MMQDSITNPQKIAIFGQYRTGTTALFYKIGNSLPADMRALFEEQKYVPQPEDANRWVLAKVILGVGMDQSIGYDSFLGFDKKIYVVRDPRDRVISQMLFLIRQSPSIYGHKDRLRHIQRLLTQKEQNPKSLSVIEILKHILAYIPNHSWQKSIQWVIRQHQWLPEFEMRLSDYVTIKYEDFVDERIEGLERYLEIPLAGSATVDPMFDYVVRTKSYGNWRDWFLEEDVKYFKPLLEGYIKRHHYSNDWSLNEQPHIQPEHCTQYIERTINKGWEPYQQQYALEKELAQRLLTANRQARHNLYSQVYREYAQRLPPQRKIAQQQTPQAQQQAVALQAQLLDPFLSPNTTFLEIGSGNNALALYLAQHVGRIMAIDAFVENKNTFDLPANFQIIEADTPPFDLPPESIDVAYSCHFIEHLHPEDAYDHAVEMYRLLASGGHYICVTPNRLYGPHDISRHFDKVASGLHLKEYGYRELAALLSSAGFKRIKKLYGIGQPPTCRPIWPYQLTELVLDYLPYPIRYQLLDRLTRWRRVNEPFRPLEQVVVVANKCNEKSKK
ncbi:MAG: class I SAM-dependent methyltransferase [Anaerolineae bacterium]|nr:class I SAM-dependent methyltransferase [Anaerolineae bacterium]